MADREKRAPESLTVTCPTCHERIAVRLAVGPQAIACTFCGAKVGVPSQEEAQKRLETKNYLPAPTVDEYALAKSDEGASPKPSRRRARIENGDAGEKNSAPVAMLECPTCHERVRADVGPAPGKVPCPFCGVMISVPDQKTLAGWRAKKIEPRVREEIGEYASGAPLETPEVHLGGVFDKLAEIRREVAPPPPRWTFFSGVFTFPWRSDVVMRWGYASVGFTAIVGIGLVLKGIAASMSGMASGVALAFFMLPIIWITFLTFSYAAACGLNILESTAAGLDRIEAWPEPNWKEWMAQIIYLGWIAGIPLAVSFGLAKLANLWGIPVVWTTPVALFAIYPISLMSALEANSIWVPVTLPIFTSLFKWFWAWLMFYLLAGAVAAGLAAVFVFSIRSSQELLLLSLGPLVAGAVFIYFRLLGRLAWRMTTKTGWKR